MNVKQKLKRKNDMAILIKHYKKNDKGHWTTLASCESPHHIGEKNRIIKTKTSTKDHKYCKSCIRKHSSNNWTEKEFSILRRVYPVKGMVGVLKLINKTKNSIYLWASKLSLKAPLRTNLIGKKINKLKILSFSHRENKRYYWLCKCECGNKKTLHTQRIYAIQSCGCLRKLVGKKNHRFTGYKEITGEYLATMRQGAKVRDLEFKITKEYLWKIFIKQNRKCALSGVDLFVKINRKDKNGTASVDRINPDKGYIIGNVQWIHKDINRMKNKYKENIFLQWCKKIAEHNK